jgi:predicted phosphate transport protein (TIGR00153 family)
MKFSLIPKEIQFFDLLDQMGRYIEETATGLEDLVRNYTDVDAKVNRIDGIEHACDEVCHDCLDKLETTFVTPFDREDIHQLVLRLDDVVDMTTSASARFPMFRITTQRPPVIELAGIITQQSKLLRSALGRLRNKKEFSMASNDCIEVHRLENEADSVIRTAIGELFEKETNAIELMRWKEIYETLETITDCGEDVANVIHGIVVKNA